jgi:hypothetical protein
LAYLRTTCFVGRLAFSRPNVVFGRLDVTPVAAWYRTTSRPVAIDRGRSLALVGWFRELHEIARGIPIPRVLEGHIEVGRHAQHVHERPQGKASIPVLLQSKVNEQTLGSGRESSRRHGLDIACTEIPPELIVEFHIWRVA